MTSPGSSVMPDEMSAMSSGILNNMKRVLEFCFSTPLTVRRTLRSSGSPMSPAGTITGPNGA